ncbi:DUF2167 domain-containing protein [Sulfurimonas sp.]|uniref:DUF2167 domain-containing protein n=1 Tax=Sulfurimonas sp. TaxID=2022749 RepID=UPI003D10688C
MYRFMIKLIVITLFCIPLWGEDIYQKEIEDAYNAGLQVLQQGPSKLAIRSQATLDLPQGVGFIPNPQATRLMKALGNRVNNEFEGMIVPISESAGWWYVTVDYTASGYIRDDDAKDWDSVEMLEQMKEGTEEMNKEFIKRGWPEIEVVGWVEQPTYFSHTHQMIWSVSSKEKKQMQTNGAGVNYNTLVLGREGYVSLNLVTRLDQVEELKPTSKELIDNLHFTQGKRYVDVDMSTDKIASYGLAALVTGVAAKKLGLFAVIAAFLAKFGKVIAIALAGGGWAAFKKFFSKKSK